MADKTLQQSLEINERYQKLLEARTVAIKQVQKKAEEEREIAKIYGLEFAEKPNDKDARERATNAVQRMRVSQAMCEESIRAIDVVFYTAKELLQ